MTNEKLIQRIRAAGAELRDVREKMTKTQRMTGAAMEIDRALSKITDALLALEVRLEAR